MNESVNKLVTSSDAATDSTPVAFDTLKALGINGYNRTASRVIQSAGGYVPDGASPELLTLAASVVNNVKAATSAGKKAAMALGFMEESKEYEKLKTPTGRPFKSAAELFAAMFPSLSSKTVNQYLNAARTIYIPAARGELEKPLMILNDLEPGTALSACSVLHDEQARKALPSAIADEMKGKSRLSQSMLRKAVNAAKAKSETLSKTTKPESHDSTEPTAESDRKAAAAADAELYRVTLRRLFRPDESDGDMHFMITESDRTDAYNFIMKGLEDQSAAILILDNLAKLIKA